MTSPSATPDRYPYQNEPIWSRSEKATAGKVFDAALKRELHEAIQEAKHVQPDQGAGGSVGLGTLPD